MHCARACHDCVKNFKFFVCQNDTKLFFLRAFDVTRCKNIVFVWCRTPLPMDDQVGKVLEDIKANVSTQPASFVFPVRAAADRRGRCVHTTLHFVDVLWLRVCLLRAFFACARLFVALCTHIHTDATFDYVSSRHCATGRTVARRSDAQQPETLLQRVASDLQQVENMYAIRERRAPTVAV